ncbi:MAG TPA: winged helix-turn-helix transcriptional regulator [Bellilinea sp.]|nr:winged helix-turn-helix transcriptional regulator [Bellilinea sp.]
MRVFEILHQQPDITVNEIADQVGINAISVRHHLNSLLADGLISSSEVIHGVGRPRLVFRLTDKGAERFPTRYLQLTNRLLNQIKTKLPKEVVKEFFADMASDLASKVKLQDPKMTLEEKLDIMQSTLENEGFSSEWEKSGDDYVIQERGCPYFQIGMEHPEVCHVDSTFIASILDLPIEKTSCMLTGDSFCRYVVNPKAGDTNGRETRN